jgi:hypothetical protein
MSHERPDNSFSTPWLTGDALFLAVTLYTMGWSYISGYYSAYGISINELTFDIREIMIFAERPLFSWMGLVVGAAIIAAGLLLFWHGRRQTRALLIMAAITLVGLSWFSMYRGRKDASIDMWETSPTLPLVRLSLDKNKLPDALFTDDPPRDGAVEGFRMLAHGKSGYFIFRPLRADVPHSGVINIRVVFLPDNSVLGTEITTGVTHE